MHVVLFGATGMVGHGVLMTALLEDPTVTGVTAVLRHPAGPSHPKLREVIHQDFCDYRQLEARALQHSVTAALPGVRRTTGS